MRTLVLVVLALAVNGCAAVLGTKQKEFDLNSAPPGADVYLNGNRLGTTPVRVKLSNQATHTFVFRREGYREATCTLNRGTDAGWVILDVLTGLVPVVIDAATGSWSQTKGSGCMQSLEATGAVASSQPLQPAPQAAPPKPAAGPVLVDDVPDGTNWIANARIRTYYRVGCPVTMDIPQSDRLYYRAETALRSAGFTKSEQCDSNVSAPPPDTPAAPGNPPAPTTDTLTPPSNPSPQTPLVETSSVAEKHSRSGFWFNGGLGYGSLGCQDCSGRDGGLSGGLALGGTLGQKVTLGVGTNGWTKSENGVSLTAGTLVALIRFYPSARGGFFLLGGLGIGSIRAEVSGFGSRTDTGVGALLGLGYDIRLGGNASLTPFWNGFAVNTSDSDANVGQIGLGVTLH